MRFPLIEFLRHATAKRGAILEGDGEVTLPPVIQPIALLGHTLTSNTNVLGATSDSFGEVMGNTIAGAAAASNKDANTTMNTGLWHIYGVFSCSYTFLAPNESRAYILQLVDPAGTGRALCTLYARATNFNYRVPFDWWLPLQGDGWFFRISFPASDAGDFTRAQWEYTALKVF